MQVAPSERSGQPSPGSRGVGGALRSIAAAISNMKSAVVDPLGRGPNNTGYLGPLSGAIDAEQECRCDSQYRGGPCHVLSFGYLDRQVSPQNTTFSCRMS